MCEEPGRCDVCGHELVETEDQQGHLALGCPLCHAQRQAQVWRGEWEAVCKQLAAARKACTWTYDDTHDKWDTSCGEAWTFSNEGSVAENGVRFCPFCGGAIQEAEKAGGAE